MRRTALVAAALLTASTMASGLGAHLAAGRAAALALMSRHVPEPGTSSTLQGVYCTSRVSCWAVGSYKPSKTVSLNEILHWNGRAWVRVSAPSPAGTASGDVSMLAAVRCAGARDCWAVGTYQRKLGAVFSQALHWTGRKWFRVAIPAAPGGSRPGDISELFDVVCTSSASCFAVGDFGVSVNRIVEQNEALHWNGRKWSLIKTPNPGGTLVGDLNSLRSIRCTSQVDCLAVGTYGTLSTMLNETLRWNGRRWLTLSAPNPAGTGGGDINVLSGLACSSPGNCWAVGTSGSVVAPSASLQNQVLHWNGTAWSQVTAPTPDAVENLLSFVTCSSSTNCWAVGTSISIDAANETVTGSNQALQWDGGMWSLVETPDPGGIAIGALNQLNAVRCPSRTDCWAVGVAAKNVGPTFGQILRWTGAKWSVR
jgi:hypothetical protein